MVLQERGLKHPVLVQQLIEDEVHIGELEARAFAQCDQLYDNYKTLNSSKVTDLIPNEPLFVSKKCSKVLEFGLYILNVLVLHGFLCVCVHVRVHVCVCKVYANSTSSTFA